MKMFEYKYLSKEHLNGLDSYKYSAIDTSPLSNYVMHPSWNAAVKLIPKRIAPNLLTFLGFLCMVVDVALLWVYDYGYTASGGPGAVVNYDQSGVPHWVFPTCGVMLFLAYNLDGIDGKQARRIGVSGPLGEMFDHGLDSFIVFLIPYCLFSLFGRDHEFSVPIFRAFLQVISVVLNFYISHIEKYTTKTLYLPWGYDFSMWLSTLLFFGPCLCGPGVYKVYLFGNLTLVRVMEIAIHLTGLLTTLPIAVYNIYLHCHSPQGKNATLGSVLRPVWSMLVMVVLVVTWAVASPNDVMSYDPRVFVLMFGIMFTNISSRLIVSCMTGQRCDLVCWLNFPLLLAVWVVLYMPRLEMLVMYLFTAFALAAHVHYGVCVVRQICEYQNIRCFVVPKEKRR
ncbi:ethanolaminephosphotransferase 1-like isoform X2 [Plodia interpunctella]|uniref:ethanolaminephosphotransferase 1-like isoform X2 n=1 Tax=Plodia interpunctella TaxID=58824 RepID=UPI002368E111|nr:ethanolaminephosphotransferase 1-like isoform X2 [Plodia interpunctella]